ncbi:MAG: hypothetical protein OCC45_02545 [Desulfotalea sp.]
MINSVSNMASSMTMRNTGSQKPPPPDGENLFEIGDTDSDGLISASELSSLTKSNALEGNSIDTDNAIATYDIDQDGGLSGEELFEMLSSIGFAPPEMTASSEESSTSAEQSMRPPPPPPPAEQVSATYDQYRTDDNELSALLELLQNDDGENQYSSINITS